MLTKACGEFATSETRVYEWFMRLPKRDAPGTSKTDENVEKAQETVVNDRRTTMREIVE